MPYDEDAFWDELGVSWRASIPDPGVMSTRLQIRLKLQSALLAAGTFASAALGILGCALAARALWIVWVDHTWNFLARGMTLAVVSVLAIMASLVLRTRDRLEMSSLREMLRASIARTECLVRATDLACYSLLILAAGGTVGYALRVRLGRPPAVSPVEDLLALALAGLALIWFRRSQARTAGKYRHIGRVFDSADDLR